MFACATAPKNTIWLRTPPEDWVSLLVSCHQKFRSGDGSNRDAMHTIAHLFYNIRPNQDAKSTAGHPWETLFDHDIIPTLIDLLSDFDFDADIVSHGLNVVRDHLSDLLALLAASLEYLHSTLDHAKHPAPYLDVTDCLRCAAAGRALGSVTYFCPAVFENIWNHRTPLFDTDREGMFRDHCNMNPDWQGLHGTVCAVAGQFVWYTDSDKEGRALFTWTIVPVVKLCLSVWIYAVRKLQREKAMSYVHSGLTHDDGALMFNTWYLGVTKDDVEPSRISKAFLRDLKDKDVVGEGLARRLVLLISFRETPALIFLHDPVELSIFWYSLAGYRRNLCSGHLDAYQEDRPQDTPTELKPKERTFDFMILAIAGSLKWRNAQRDSDVPLIPFVHIHATIPVIAETLLGRTTDEAREVYGESFYVHLRNSISHRTLIQHYERLQVNTLTGFARPSQSMRKLSIKYWHKANDWLMAQKHHTNPRWRPFCHAWKLLGDALERGEDTLRSFDTQPDALEPAKRCAWDECLCSAYKPTHDLRLCKGCWAVAYCNSKCQTGDWENHRRTCARGWRDGLNP